VTFVAVEVFGKGKQRYYSSEFISRLHFWYHFYH